MKWNSDDNGCLFVLHDHKIEGVNGSISKIFVDLY